MADFFFRGAVSWRFHGGGFIPGFMGVSYPPHLRSGSIPGFIPGFIPILSASGFTPGFIPCCKHPVSHPVSYLAASPVS